MKDKRVPRKVIYLNLVRLDRDLKACQEAGKVMDDHDRASLWDKAHGKGEQTNKADEYDGYQMTEQECLNAIADQEGWDGNEDGGS
jgi:hypothetical protein